MREIKFRAWYQEIMVPWDRMIINFDQLGLKASLEDYGPNLMQYTGLKDKNGKEIYEGDIVRWERFDEIARISEIVWEGATISPNYLLNLYGEVIGNIYENPELLTN